MAHNTRGQSSPPSYIDGISVKISESYKPPKRINLALSYSQRLTLNKLIQDSVCSYDFSLEESVKNKMCEWRKARNAISEDRRQRLQQLSQENRSRPWDGENSADRNEVLSSKSNCDTDCTSQVSTKENLPGPTDALGPYYCTESGVLIPVSVGAQVNRPVYPTEKGFNFSEFESDTSSPFDNMELKTINDLAELAEVLKRDSDTSPKVAAAQNNGVELTKDTQVNQINGYYFNRPMLAAKSAYGSEGAASQTVDLPQTGRENSVRSVSEIMRSLEEELAINHISEPVAAAPAPSPADLPENPLKNLSAALQQKAVAISTMGFPLDRVARACQTFDGNQKKIVEHLLAMSDLLDLGFPEDQVVSALLKCDNDRDKALDLLIT